MLRSCHVRPTIRDIEDLWRQAAMAPRTRSLTEFLGAKGPLNAWNSAFYPWEQETRSCGILRIMEQKLPCKRCSQAANARLTCFGSSTQWERHTPSIF